MIGLILMMGCSPLISNFDQVSYQQVTSLKVDALSVMDEAVTDYGSHASEVKDLQLKVDKAIEYDKHRPHNEITNEMWSLLNDPQKNLLGGFLVKWQHDGKCSAVYIAEKKKQISLSFDQIAELESKKIKTVNK